MVSLTDEQRMLVNSLEQLAEDNFAENAYEWHGEPPWENIELLAENGFLGVNLPVTYGGGGMTELEAMLTIDVVGRVCPDTAQILYYQQMVGPRTIDMFGSDHIKETYLEPITAGEEFIAVAISEPEAGSDVKSMNTTVRETDDGLVINGEKVWVSFFRESQAAVVWTKFEDEGLGSVIVDLDQPGVEMQQHYTNMAGHTQTQFYMEDVPVPEENVLTRGDDAFVKQMKALSWERLGSATLSNAIACCAIRHAVDYAEQREQFGQPIIDFQGIGWKLADMVKETEASRALTYNAAQRAVAEGRIPDRLYSSLAKLYSAEMVERVVSEGLQVHGSNGYQQGHPLEYLYRLARARRIAAGTDEIQKNGIADVLKKQGPPPV